MRSKFYLGAYGNESDIRALNDSLQLSGSEMKALRFKPTLGQSNQGPQWMWRTPYQECSSGFPEDELTAFLRGNSDLLQQLKAHRDELHDLAAMIVCELDEGERPQGYSISAGLMKLLADANASLEIDIVPLVTENRTGEGR